MCSEKVYFCISQQSYEKGSIEREEGMGKGRTSIMLVGFIALALACSAVDVFALRMSPGEAGISGLPIDRVEELIPSPKASSCWTILHRADVPPPFKSTSGSSDELRAGLGYEDHLFAKGELPKHFHEGAAKGLCFDAPTEGSAEGGSAPVPEPSTVLLLGSGLIGLAGYLRKSKK
jgi:hypothetical protein